MIFMRKSIESEQAVVATCRTSKRAFLGSMGKNRNGQPDSHQDFDGSHIKGLVINFIEFLDDSPGEMKVMWV